MAARRNDQVVVANDHKIWQHSSVLLMKVAAAITQWIQRHRPVAKI